MDLVAQSGRQSLRQRDFRFLRFLTSFREATRVAKQ